MDNRRFYQHGWQSWSVTGWRPLDAPVRHPVVDAHRRQATDPAHLDEPFPGGSWVGAVERDDGSVGLTGSLGVDAWVTAFPSGLDGSGAGPWFVRAGPEREVFSAYAEAVRSELGSRGGAPPNVWSSWYSFYDGVGESDMHEVLAGLVDLAFDVVQVDDGWQQHIGDWMAGAEFPSGMQDMASRIRSTGRTPGLWLAPFLVHEASDLARTHPEMLLRDAHGRPVVAAGNWGGVAYSLDVTRPDALDFVSETIGRVVAWGYEYLKLDFLYSVALPTGTASDSHREASYRHAIETIRDVAGEDTYLNACGAPVMSSIGVFDGIRVGPDVGPVWDNVDRTQHLADRSGPGAADAIATSVARYWLKSLIDIDPDVVYFRTKASLLTSDQRRMLADVARVCGFKATSDPPSWIDDAERAELEAFLLEEPEVEHVGRNRFLVDGRDVDFGPVVEARPW